MSGHNHFWAQSCLGTIVSWHNRVWAQSCLGTVVWAQSCGPNHVWAQTWWNHKCCYTEGKGGGTRGDDERKRLGCVGPVRDATMEDLKLNIGVSIIQVYAPQQGRQVAEKEEFYCMTCTGNYG